MTLQTVLAWSIGRSLIITTLAVPVSLLIVRCLRDGRLPFHSRRWLTLAALAPLFVPNLLIGFTYRLTSAHLIHSVAATEGLYGLLLLIQVTALQVAVSLILASSAVSRESLHSWRLLPQNSVSWWFQWIRMLVRGPLRTPLVAWAGGALICFQEFETAALLQIDRHPIAFTVWLFDAHGAGEPLWMSLRFVSWSMLFQAAVLLPAIALLQDTGIGPLVAAADLRNVRSRAVDSRIRAVALIAICGSLLTVLFWPVASHGLNAVAGFRSLLEQGSLRSRIEQVAFSLLAASMASLLAVISARVGGRGRSWASLTLIVPGLCGSLVLSLVLLAAFQLPVLTLVYDTWLPMLLGQTLLMLPRAFLLVVLLDVTSTSTAVHLGNLLTTASQRSVAAKGRYLLWRLESFRWLLAVAVLTHWCFWDVAVVSTLRPVSFEPVVTRLYNEMHYQRTETLVAITLLALIIPILTFVVTGLVWQYFPKQRQVKHG